MKTIDELLMCIEDDIELLGENRIIYLMEVDGQIVDYDYLPSADYGEAVKLIDLQRELKKSLALQNIEKDREASVPKLAVLFPGVGYTCDKPLLYYTSKMLQNLGYTIIKIAYTGLPDNIKGNPELKKKAFETALSCADQQLKDINWNTYKDILFVSKSVGTVVSSAYSRLHNIPARNILFTPVQETFAYASTNSIAFHGLKDDWADSEKLIQTAKEKGIPMYLTKDANHSLETGEWNTDIKNLQEIMAQVEHYLIS